MDLFGVHEQALYLRSQRGELLSSNIFNAATPNFKARDLDVGANLQAMAENGPLARTQGPHFSNALEASGGPLYRVPVEPSLDGNTVDLAYEQVQFSQNAVQHRATLSFLNARISNIRRALRGE
ncbi:MAG: flagellar basal body rod protein FlgB [Gammaproteobacteria bacterium]|jgi:flagellar basal-body rod protein FlgB|nr:flagellar basal body rod protein FlgB [Gammaproteobacteria bacterium]